MNRDNTLTELPTMRPTVFISYARESRDVNVPPRAAADELKASATKPNEIESNATVQISEIKNLRRLLTDWGFGVVLDSDIPAGDYFRQAIDAGLRNALAVVVCCTPKAKNNDWVVAELRAAQTHGLLVVPLWMDGTNWDDCIPMEHQGRQRIEYRQQHKDERDTQHRLLLRRLMSAAHRFNAELVADLTCKSAANTQKAAELTCKSKAHTLGITNLSTSVDNQAAKLRALSLALQRAYILTGLLALALCGGAWIGRELYWQVDTIKRETSHVREGSLSARALVRAELKPKTRHFDLTANVGHQHPDHINRVGAHCRAILAHVGSMGILSVDAKSFTAGSRGFYTLQLPQNWRIEGDFRRPLQIRIGRGDTSAVTLGVCKSTGEGRKLIIQALGDNAKGATPIPATREFGFWVDLPVVRY